MLSSRKSCPSLSAVSRPRTRSSKSALTPFGSPSFQSFASPLCWKLRIIRTRVGKYGKHVKRGFTTLEVGGRDRGLLRGVRRSHQEAAAAPEERRSLPCPATGAI